MIEDEYGPIPPEPADTATGSGEAYTRRGNVTWADTIGPEPVVWAWAPDGAGRIPAGSLSMAAGREATGKSSFGIWLTAQVTRGTLPGSFFGSPRRVLYVAVEDSWKHTLVPRLMAAGADLSLVGRFGVKNIADEDALLSLPMDNALLEEMCKKHKIAAVVIDPLLSVIGEGIDTHRARDVRKALDPLAALADRTEALFLGIAHFGKGQGTDAASLITGSGAFKDVPRSVFGFARDDSDENGGRVMTQVKNSLGRDELPSLSYRIVSAHITTKKGIAETGKFEFTGESERSVHDILRDAQGGSPGEEPEERDDAAKWLAGYLRTREGDWMGMTLAKDVKAAGKEAGIAERTLHRARKGAGVEIDRFDYPARSVWRLTSVAPQSRQLCQGSEAGTTGTTGGTTVTSSTPAAVDKSVDRSKRATKTRHLTVAAPTPPPVFEDGSAQESLVDGCTECGGVAGHCSDCSRRGAS